MTLSAKTGRLLLPIFFLLVLFVVSLSTGYGQRDAQAQAAPAAQAAPSGPAPCPGEPMPVQATGVYQPKPVPEIVINGQPGPGAIWQPGMRSYLALSCRRPGDDGVRRRRTRAEARRTHPHAA